MAVENKPSQEDGFRESLQDVVAIADRLSLHCHTVQELVELCQSAIEHDWQLRLVMSQMTQKTR